MPPIADTLRNARERARLDQALLARMVGIEEDRLKQIEAGDTEPTPEELDTWAQVFGLDIRQLMAGEAASAPLTRLFFRSASEGGQAGLEELVANDAHLVIGEFMRTVRDIAELETLLSRPLPPELPQPPKELVDKLYGTGGEELATWLRRELGLGIEPIPSVQGLVTKRLGICILWVTPEDLDPAIDGASTPVPRPAILVNLIGGPTCWWRTRMTLVHELCHLLCERTSSGERFAMFSPHMRKEIKSKWQVFNNFESIEQRANAFAACFLAPKDAVERLIGDGDPTSEVAIAAVGRHFGLGRTTAINRLQRVFGLSKETRASMLERSKHHWISTDDPDNVSSATIGMRSGILSDLVIEARSRELIDELRGREYLRLPLSEPFSVSLERQDAHSPAASEPGGQDLVSFDRVTEKLTTREAAARLPELLKRVQQGQEVILLAQDNQPIAKIVPAREARQPRSFGDYAGKLWMADDFDAELPEEFWLGSTRDKERPI